MKYVILIRSNPESRAMWESFDAATQAEGFASYQALANELTSRGELVATEALADPSTGVGIRVTNGEVLTTDAPFAEAKELLAGFFLIDVDSHERAIEVAARIPEAELGLVELRPVMTLDLADA